ncbi:hypothetical protein RYH80_03850 [Halobaculum sp. MBLA0147]|uniref:hypothetical protein n=1 Tax=Halobaculum sp. MBLA0147 TaxID=3079934 RepID=UPI0035264DC9
MSTRSLAEPAVLASTKRRLFGAPDDPEPDRYVVADTQFTREEWLDGDPVPERVRETLAPFNHVEVGSGYPDLVGVHDLDDDLLAVDRLGSRRPLVAVEAKGLRTGETGADVERGVTQAYDRLDEANVAFVAAPHESVGQATRTMAAELNVGLLGVTAAGDVEPLVRPRVVGGASGTDGPAGAVRFQASPQGVARNPFGLNHPKNYLAVPLAVTADGETSERFREAAVDVFGDAVRGAVALGLVERHAGSVRLRPLGAEVVRFAERVEGDVADGLNRIDDWTGSRRRFCDLAPRWGDLARRVLYRYPATETLVTELQRLADDGVPEPSVVDLVVRLHELRPAFAVELFVRGTDDARRRVLDDRGALRERALTDANVYHSPTLFQYKTMLYHAGLLAERGTEPSNVDDPTATNWGLRDPLSRVG